MLVSLFFQLAKLSGKGVLLLMFGKSYCEHEEGAEGLCSLLFLANIFWFLCLCFLVGQKDIVEIIICSLIVIGYPVAIISCAIATRVKSSGAGKLDECNENAGE